MLYKKLKESEARYNLLFFFTPRTKTIPGKLNTTDGCHHVKQSN